MTVFMAVDFAVLPDHNLAGRRVEWQIMKTETLQPS